MNLYLLFCILVCVNAYGVDHVKFSGNGVFGYIECGIHRFDARQIVFQLECNACGTRIVHKCDSTYKCNRQTIEEVCNNLIYNYNYLDSRIVCISNVNYISCIEFKDIDESKSSINIKTGIVKSALKKKSETKIEYTNNIDWEKINDADTSRYIEDLRRYFVFAMELKNVMHIYDELSTKVYSKFIDIIKSIKKSADTRYSETYAYKSEIPVSVFVRNFLNLYYSQKTVHNPTLDSKIMLISTLGALYGTEHNFVNEYGSMKLSLDRSKCSILNIINSSAISNSEYCLYLSDMLALESRASEQRTYNKCGKEYVANIKRYCANSNSLLFRAMSIFGKEQCKNNDNTFPCTIPVGEENIYNWLNNFNILVHSANLQHEDITFAIQQLGKFLSSEQFAKYMKCTELNNPELIYDILNQLIFDSLNVISDKEDPTAFSMIVEIYNKYTAKVKSHEQLDLYILNKIYKFMELKSTNILNIHVSQIKHLLLKVLKNKGTNIKSSCSFIISNLRNLFDDSNIKCPN